MLGSLGHSVEERDPDCGWINNDAVPRFLGGIADHGTHVDRPERLEPRTRGILRMGGALPAGIDPALPRQRGEARRPDQPDLRRLRRADLAGDGHPDARGRPVRRAGAPCGP